MSVEHGIQNEVRPRPIVSEASFLFPNRANTFPHGIPQTDQDKAILKNLMSFSTLQANAANECLDALFQIGQRRKVSAQDWEDMHDYLVDLRKDWAAESGGHTFGKSYRQEPERVKTLITDAYPNCNQVGKNGRFRANSYWNDATQTWEGGEPTPASDTMERIGEIIEERFAAEGKGKDEIQNKVLLPDGKTKVDGTRLLKGAAAKSLAVDLKAKIGSAKGEDAVRHFVTGGDILYIVTGSESDRAEIFKAAMEELGEQEPGKCNPDTLSNIAYLLYQSLKNKRGGDAVLRTHYVIQGTYLLGYPPIPPQDIDLRAYAHRQNDFIDYMKKTSRSLS